MSKGSYLSIAIRDLNNSRDTFKVLKEYSLSSYLSQQAIENAFKAVIAAKFKLIDDNPLLKSHNLRNLYESIKSYFPQLENEITNLASITNFYFVTRYPGEDYYECTEYDAKSSLSLAELILNLVSEELSETREFKL